MITRPGRLQSACLGLMLAAATALSGCAAVNEGVSCTGKANNVHQSAGTPSDMVGKATGSCTGVVTISGYVEIQGKIGPAWYNKKRTTITAFNTVPNKSFTRQAATHCSSGTFRTKTVIKGTYKGQSHTETRYSGAVTNPCG